MFAANAGDDDAGERAVRATIERFGGLDILVNNAATNPYFGAVLGVDGPRYDKTFQVNLTGAAVLVEGGLRAGARAIGPGSSSTSRRWVGSAPRVVSGSTT